MSHVGSRLLADAADRTTLTGRLSDTLDRLRRPRTRHDPGRVLVDMAVAVADGASTLSDVAILADQAAVFGPVASDSTCWRLLDRLDDQVLASVAAARARAREVVWAQHAETHGQAFPASRVAGRDLGQTLMIDLDATIVIAHSEKEHPTTPASSSPGNFVAATPVRTPPPTQRLHFPGCRWTTIQISGRARAR
nr:transposase [Pseudonocardia ammonioxydans]